MIERIGNEIHIPLSKTKNLLILVGAIGFIAICILNILYFADTQIEYDPDHLKVLSVVMMLFFIWTFFKALKKLWDKKPGLILNQEGFINNSTSMKANRILWRDITQITEDEIKHNHFLIIHVKNPKHYLDQIEGSLQHKMALMNQSQYGMPISISATILKCNFEALKQLMEEEWNKHKS